MQKEKWRDIKGFKGFYQVSNKGNVKSLSRKMWNGYGYWKSREKILKQHINKRGYYEVSLSKNGYRKLCTVHRLVAIAFILNLKNKKEVNHLGKKTDNNVNSLEWTTPIENMQHAFKTGRINHKGIKNGASKLNTKEVIEILENYNEKDNFTKIGKLYGVSYFTISRIIYRKTWKHI